MAEVFDNAVSVGTRTTLSAPLSATDTTLQVRAPASEELQKGEFRVIIINPVDKSTELALVKSGSWSTDWVVVRGIERTTPLDFPQESIVKHIITAGSITSLRSSSVPVGGVWDAIDVGDATGTLDTPYELVSPQAELGPWAIGKTFCWVGAGPGHSTIVGTIEDVNGAGNAILDQPISTAVSNSRVVIGTDDSSEWEDAVRALPTKPGSSMALREGISIMKVPVQFPQNCTPYGQSKNATKIIAAAPDAGFRWGTPFALGQAATPWGYGRSVGFNVDGIWVAKTPLFINANNAIFDDIASLFGVGDGVICAGQNCILNGLSSGAHLGSNVVLDNGCGDYVFNKPELNFAGKYHVEIRTSKNAEGVGYGIPEYCYFNEGICEGRNSFWPGGTLGSGCMLISSGRFHAFNDMQFFTDSWDASDTVRAIVRIRGWATDSSNSDPNYWVNGDHEFRSCTWLGPGSGAGIEHDNIDSSGNKQLFQAVFRPYVLSGHNVFIALDAAESHASLSSPRITGQITLA